MNQDSNTFIPHESKPKTNTQLGGAFLVLALIIFLVSVVVGGMSFILRRNSASQLLTYKNSLDVSRTRFSEGLPIRSIEEFDKRLKASKDLLNRHKSFDGLFGLIEKITLKNVQFVSFSYSEIDNTKKNVVRLTGRAPDYKTIAEESEQFSLDPDARRYITDVVFSNLSVDPKTNLISFEIMFTVDPEFLLYRRYVSGESNTNTGLDNSVESVRQVSPNIKNQ